MKIATWNVNSLTARLPYLLEWFGRECPEVVCLQETKLGEEAFPREALAEAGYESVHHGQGQWNGVAILSRVGIEEVGRGFEDGQGARMIAADCGGIRVVSVYVPNGRSLDSEHYKAKLAWFGLLGEFLAEVAKPEDDVIVGGDFNVAPTDEDVYDAEAFETHVSPAERRALEGLLTWGLVDLNPEHYTWWDYRGGSLHRGLGMRIDLLLATGGLARRAGRIWVDREARKKSPEGNGPSDHAPLLVEFDESGAA